MSLKSLLRLNPSSKQSSSNASSSRQGWSAWQIAGACAAAAGAYVAYRVGRRLYVVFTFHDPAAAIEHGCVPADGDEDAWDHRCVCMCVCARGGIWVLVLRACVCFVRFCALRMERSCELPPHNPRKNTPTTV